MKKSPHKHSWLTPKELSGHFGLLEDSAYRWIDGGLIPKRWLKYGGRRRIFIRSAAIPHLEKNFRNAHPHGRKAR